MSALDTLSQELQQAINGAATTLNADANSLATVVQIESSGNVNAPNGGAFQLQPRTAAQYGVVNVNDAQSSALGAGQYWTDVGTSLTSRLGTAIEPWQQYIGYQQGPSGGFALLTADPNIPAAQALINAGYSPSYAQSAISGNLPSSFNGGDPGSASVGQFLGYWQQKWNAVSGQTSAGADGVPQTATATAPAAQPQDKSWSGWASHWIIRIFLFLLGLVFVAAGLFLLSKTGKLTIAGIQGNVAGNLANRVAPSPVQRYQLSEAAPSVDRGKGGGKNMRIKGTSQQVAHLKKLAGVS